MKRTLKIAVSCAVAAALFPIGYAVGQGGSELTKEQMELVMLKTAIESGGSPSDYARIVDLYATAPDNTAIVKQAARGALVVSPRAASTSLSIIQVMQSQKIIEQNERIIKLLEARK